MKRDSEPKPEALAVTLTSDTALDRGKPTAAELPDMIGRFKIDAKIGEGGMGIVLLATDLSLARRVALKLLRAGTETDADGRLRFLREAQVMARLAHENVVVVHEVGEHEGRGYVAMEYVAGGTLKGWQTGRGWREILAMYVRAGRGLEAAHRAGLVHRDFKPDNVLVGEDGRVRVTDFGLAAVAGTNSGDVHAAHRAFDVTDTRLTGTGAVMGTPRYMAPEQHRGGVVDARADQFAFCVALYEALFSRPPFVGETYVEIAANVTEGEMRSPPRDSEVPLAIRDAIVRGLARARDDRFASMSELLAILEAASAPRARGRRWLVPTLALGAVAVAGSWWFVHTPPSTSTAAIVDAAGAGSQVLAPGPSGPEVVAADPTAVAKPLHASAQPGAPSPSEIAALVAHNYREPWLVTVDLEEERPGFLKWSRRFNDVPIHSDVLSVKVGSRWENRWIHDRGQPPPFDQEGLISEAQAATSAGLAAEFAAKTVHLRPIYLPIIVNAPLKDNVTNAKDMDRVIGSYQRAFEVLDARGKGALVDAYNGTVITRLGGGISEFGP